MKCYTMSELHMGQKASVTMDITEDVVLTFAKLFGDVNPIHIDEEFAKTTKFKKRIAHGPIAGSLIGTVLGTQLPGANSVYVSQEHKFLYPIFVGDVITTELEVIGMEVERNRLKLKCTLTNQEGKVVLEGIAVTMPAKSK